ncbi:unnamed protein product [Arctia plantaginis]|uniref:Uncharacterized protein n=1 Tax=Arctia plantaginis TaxID=874455 RepID=A0A8S0ZFK8_ARCPL|nr:unnamed protein product [Arctia plantaginis]
MALDKQKILNELGSVVNQLQSANCGCMGKLFSNSGQANYNPGHMTGHNGGYNMPHCGYAQNQGYNSPCAGEPYGGRRCMGYCNPPKLYSDTYNYLNRNLMQPVVQEVYQDLKSINPDNTIMNSPMAAQMGLPATNNSNQGNMGQNSMPAVPLGNPNTHCGHMHGPHLHFGNVAMDNPNAHGMGQMGQGMEQGHMGHGMGHMGHGMDHMRQEEEHGMRQMGQEQGMGVIGQDQGMSQMGQQQGMGQIGQHQGMGQMGQEQGMGHMGQGMNQMGHMGHGMGHMNHEMDRSGGVMGDMGQHIMKMMTSSNVRPNKIPNVVTPQTNVPGNMPQSGDNGNMMSANNQGQYNSGQMQNITGYMQQGHPEMQTQQNTFPGAAENAQSNQMHGNMNPMISGSRPTGNMNAKNLDNHGAYGQHSPGISKFNEMFPGIMKGDLGFDPMAIAIQMNPANQQKTAMDTMEKLMMNNSRGLNKVMDSKGNASPLMQPVINAAHAASARINQPNQPRIEETGQKIPESQRDNNLIQQNDQIPQRLYRPPQQQMIDPNTGAVINNPPLPTVYEGSEDPNAKQQPPVSYTTPPTAPEMYKDPILPADTSRNLLHSHHFHHSKPPKYYEYNTIGQPVERQYQSADNPSKYSHVKQTVSKTALVGNKPIGRIPSRTQQQVIYNQYKGSQSFTQQNIKPNARNVTHSDPRIALPEYALQAPIEKYNGDSAANDEVTPVNAKFPNVTAKQAAEKNVKLRNGLQDQVFSAYPTSAKWSFHGNNSAAPYSVGYRLRSK